MQINKNVQCVGRIDIKLVKVVLSSKKTCKAKIKVLMKAERKNLEFLIKQIEIVHLQMLLPIKIGNLPLTHYHATLSGDSVSNSTVYSASILSQNS